MKILPCGGCKIPTEYGYEYDCEYGFDDSCDNCVCCGGSCDPRYPSEKQPYKLSKFIEYARQVSEKKLKEEF